MSHSCVEIYIHAIFSTKNRMALIPQNLEERLYGYFSGIAKERKVPILKANGMADHIHLLLKLHATTDISTLLKELKSYSSTWMKKQGVIDFAWQDGYGAFSCSITHVEALIKYIENQKEHHKTHSFDEELAKLNKLWGCQFAPVGMNKGPNKANDAEVCD